MDHETTILVIEDDEGARSLLADFLGAAGWQVRSAEGGADGIAALTTGPADAVLLDLMMAPPDGFEVLRRALEGGGRGPAPEPERSPAPEPAGDGEAPPVLSGAMDRVWDLVERIADTDVPVLLVGESGVGKDVIARRIHARSRRAARPFVKVNCAALPGELLESELFGHERGAFTGAHAEKPGKFELAHQGTIFLDEIGEMDPRLQAKLLEVLQDEEFYRVGGKRPVRVDSRVVTATNRVLEDAISAP
jgi:two-component system response regulator AtoC